MYYVIYMYILHIHVCTYYYNTLYMYIHNALSLLLSLVSHLSFKYSAKWCEAEDSAFKLLINTSKPRHSGPCEGKWGLVTPLRGSVTHPKVVLEVFGRRSGPRVCGTSGALAQRGRGVVSKINQATCGRETKELRPRESRPLPSWTIFEGEKFLSHSPTPPLLESVTPCGGCGYRRG